MVSLVPLHDAITAHVKALLPLTPVEEDTMPDEHQPPVDANMQLIPYVILRYGPLRKSPGPGGMASIRQADYYGTIDVMTVAPVGRMAREMLDIVQDSLLGFDAGGGGEMHLDGAASNFVVTSNEARPTQMVCMTRMRFMANGRNVGQPIVRP